jgi:hypothetical protein
MPSFNFPFPFFILLLLLVSLIFSVWNLAERRTFLRFEGNLKRGVMIWTDPLAGEMRQWLETMPADFRDKQGFMRKEGREVLVVVENRPLWGIVNRRRQWPYIGYINLAEPQSQLEFRILWSNLFLWLVLIPSLFVAFFVTFAYPYLRHGFELVLPCFFPFIVLIFLVGSIWFNHYQERKRLLAFLNRVTGSKR